MNSELNNEAYQKYPDRTYPVGSEGRPYDPNYLEREAFIKGANSDYVQNKMFKLFVMGIGVGFMLYTLFLMVIIHQIKPH